jgi:hypothetical protein
MVIQYGDVVAGPDCNLVAGDSGLFRFNGKAGERIIVVGSRGGGGNVCAELRGPDGLPTTKGALQCTSNPSIRIDEQPLTQDGTYTIIVSEANNDQTLNYTVKRDCLLGSTCNLPAFPCKGDFDRDADVDNVDAFRFRQEFGRKDCPL